MQPRTTCEGRGLQPRGHPLNLAGLPPTFGSTLPDPKTGLEFWVTVGPGSFLSLFLKAKKGVVPLGTAFLGAGFSRSDSPAS